MKTKLFYFIVLFSLIYFPINSQTPDIDWELSIGGIHFEQVRSVQQTSDEGYLVVGYSTSFTTLPGHNGVVDYFIVRLDFGGDIIWQKLFGGTSVDIAESGVQTSDGGYIIAGFTMSSNGDVSQNFGGGDIWVVKLDDTGEIEWEKSYGGSEFEGASSIIQTNEGGYIVAGFTYSTDGDISENFGGGDYWVLKLDSTGEIEWEKSLGGTGDEEAKCIQQTTDGGYIVAGISNSTDGHVSSNNGDVDYWVVKLDPLGEIEWEMSYGGSDFDWLDYIKEVSDGGFILAGYTYSSDGDVSVNYGDSDYWVVKIDSVGNLEWEKSLGGSGEDYAHGVDETDEGDFVIVGSTNSSDGDVTVQYGDFDQWIVKLSASGDLLWEKSLGTSLGDYGYGIEVTTDEGFIVVGSTNVNTNTQASDFWIVKLKPEPLSILDFNNYQVAIYPNPTTGIINIETTGTIEGIRVYDITGKQVTAPFSLNDKTIDISRFSKGVYFAHITIDGQTQTQKIIKK